MGRSKLANITLMEGTIEANSAFDLNTARAIELGLDSIQLNFKLILISFAS